MRQNYLDRMMTARDPRFARIAEKMGKRPAKAPPAVDPMVALREEYLDKLGKRPFNGWDATELRRRIDAAGDE